MDVNTYSSDWIPTHKPLLRFTISLPTNRHKERLSGLSLILTEVTIMEAYRGCKIICVNGIFSKTFKGLQNAYQQRSY